MTHLPRDSRDTLFLLGVIAWTIAPHLSHLPWWCGSLAAVVLAWRARLALANAPLPPRWLLAAVLAVALGATYASERTLLGKDAGVMLLVLLMVLKTLELRARRDALVVFFLGFFLVLTNFLYSQSIGVAVAMLGSVWGLLTALVLAHMPVGQPSLKQAGGLAARAAVLGAPAMVALFLLFPRIGPLWGLPEDALPKTGLSGTLRMGGVAELAVDDSVAFRVRFDGAPPPRDALYWRGPVLSQFDGREWKRGESFGAWRQSPQLRALGPAQGYEITLEPSRLALLPLLEATPALDADALKALNGTRAWLRSDLQWATDRPLDDRLRLHANAVTRFRHGPTEATAALRDDVHLPPGNNPRTLAWAAALRRSHPGADADALARLLLQHLRSEPYVYTLAPGEYGPDAVDEFWFDRRAGFCEHYASAFVVLMRALDVPARIVTGYQGSDPEPVDGYYVVRQSHAHAWAEYWQPGRGWTHADPTAAVAPERVVRSRQLQPAPGFVANTMRQFSPRLLAQLRLAWERLDNRWNQWVLGYSRRQQFDLLQALGIGSPDWQDLALLLTGLLSTAALAGAGWAWWDRRRQDPWQRLLSRVRARLQRLQVPAPMHAGPRALAAAARQALGARGEALAQRLLELELLRYGPAAAAVPRAGWWSGFRRAAAAAGRG